MTVSQRKNRYENWGEWGYIKQPISVGDWSVETFAVNPEVALEEPKNITTSEMTTEEIAGLEDMDSQELWDKYGLRPRDIYDDGGYLKTNLSPDPLRDMTDEDIEKARQMSTTDLSDTYGLVKSDLYGQDGEEIARANPYPDLTVEDWDKMETMGRDELWTEYGIRKEELYDQDGEFMRPAEVTPIHSEFGSVLRDVGFLGSAAASMAGAPMEGFIFGKAITAADSILNSATEVLEEEEIKETSYNLPSRVGTKQALREI